MAFRLGDRQITALAKILEFSEDETLVEEKQQQLKKECMEAWGVEIRARSGPPIIDPDVLVRNLLKNDIGKRREVRATYTSLRIILEYLQLSSGMHQSLVGRQTNWESLWTAFTIGTQ